MMTSNLLKRLKRNNENHNFLIAGTTLALGAALTLAGCGGNNGGDNAGGNAGGTGAATGAATTSGTGSNTGGGTQLTGAGATFPAPIYKKWFAEYGQKNNVQINYQDNGSGAGIKNLTDGTVDFGASDAPLKDEDLSKMPSPAVHVPTVAGAVAITYNLPGVSKVKLSGDVLANIFMGKVKTWNDPSITATNAGVKLPAMPISVVTRSDGSGTTNIFTTYLKAVSPEFGTKVGAGKKVNWPGGGISAKGSAGVTEAVKKSPGGITYTELNYAIKNNLPYASIKNKAGQFVDPSVDSVEAAATSSAAATQKDVRAPIVNAADPKAYPIAGYTYILLYKTQKDAAKGKVLKEMLTWAITDGQAEAKDLYYAPLPAAVVKANQATLASIQ